MSGTLNEQLQQIADTKNAIANAINAQGVEVTESDSFATYATKIGEIQGGSGSSSNGGFNLFDIKFADHELEGNEALGWAEQGTNVLKSDYPDFYNKCLEEYNESTLSSIYINNNITVIGNLINDKGTISGFSPTDYGQTPVLPLTQPFEIHCGITVDSDVTNFRQFFSGDVNTTISLTISNSKFKYFVGNGSSFLNYSTSEGATTILPNTRYYIKLIFDGNNYTALISTDGKEWIEDYSYSTTEYPGEFVGNIGVSRVHDGDWAGKIHLTDYKVIINNEIYWEGTKSIPLLVNNNGHKYYDYSNMADIDQIYAETLNADFYGIDQELEYIILPRNSHFNQDEAIRKTYYCVGNTVVDESTIDISKEIELNNPFFLGQSQYFENEPNNLSWLKSTGEFHSKELYPSMYEYISENIKAGTKDFATINSEYNDYCYVLDEENETFRLPLLNGSEAIVSDKIQNFSNPASGTNYTAPANGWFNLHRTSTANNQYVYLGTSTITKQAESVATGTNLRIDIEVKRGDNVHISYNAPTAGYFRFIYAQGNGSLYYFVGEAVNNANLVNVANVTKALANKVDINSDRFDGQWISKDVTMVTSASFSSSNVTYDLSEYLPNDGYEYEVIIGGYLSTSASSGKFAALYVGSDIMTSPIYLGACITRTSSNAQAAGSVACPVGLGRFIFVQGNASSGTYTLHIHGYRRLGRI